MTEKLSVGKVLDKLRSTDPPTESKLQRLDQKLQEQDQEILRLREQRHRLERDQRAAARAREADATKPAAAAGKQPNRLVAAFMNMIGRKRT